VVHTVGPAIAYELEAMSTSRKKGSGGVSNSGASYRYGALGGRVIYLGVHHTVNFGSHALFICVDDGTHCPLISELSPNQDMGR
jgi:hypothetical protein